MIQLLQSLMAHMRWADALVADAISRDAANDADVMRLFAHIASVEHLWFSRIEGRTPEHAVWPTLSIAQARALAASHADRFDKLLAANDAEALRRQIAYRNSAGRNYRNTMADIVTHVAMHGSHHRGQIARQLRAAGHEPPYTDYIEFARRDQRT
jgi:uncharacterized damage-inducible protein DinB